MMRCAIPELLFADGPNNMHLIDRAQAKIGCASTEARLILQWRAVITSAITLDCDTTAIGQGDVRS